MTAEPLLANDANPKSALPTPAFGLGKEDAALPALAMLFDGERVRKQADANHLWLEAPESVVLGAFSHWPGHRAVAVYDVHWPEDAWLAPEQLCIEASRGKADPDLYYAIDDPHLPGLSALSDPGRSLRLIQRHVGVHPHRLSVSPVRYRATQRAVVQLEMWWRQGSVRKLGMHARAMRPDKLDGWFDALNVMRCSGYGVPSVLGTWADGGVVWLETLAGPTLRQLISAGKAPAPELVLEGMAPLWQSATDCEGTRALDLDANARYTTDLIKAWLPQVATEPDIDELFAAVLAFAGAWRPSSPAHNDFHDAQLIFQPNGRLGIVDFDEAAKGDALLDVANMLAHMRWMATFGPSKRANEAYRLRLRAAALRHFGGDLQGLAIREALSLLRLSSNPLRQARDGFDSRTRDGLKLAASALAGVE